MFALITGMVCSLYKYKPQTPYIPLLCIVLPTYLLQSYIIILIERRKLNKILPPIPAGEQTAQIKPSITGSICKHLRPLLHIFPLLIITLLTVAACVKTKDGYDLFMNIAVTIWGLYSIYEATAQKPQKKYLSFINVIAGAIAILYNPILPLDFNNGTWTNLQIITIPAVLICTYLTHRHTPADNQ